MKTFKGLITALGALALSALLGLGGAAIAGNTGLWTSKTGTVVFPFSPPTTNPAAPGAIDNMVIGATTPKAATVTTLTANDMIASAAGAPTISSGGCGTGTNGSVTGTNQTGQITIGATATTACTVNFSKTLGVAPKACIVFPANAAAAATGTTVAYVSAITTAHFVLTGSALASTVYNFVCM